MAWPVSRMGALYMAVPTRLILSFAIVAVSLLPALVLAETVTLGFTESVVNTAGGNPALQHCTIYRCQGTSCTDWQPIKRITRSSVDGGGVRSEQVIVHVSAGELP